jgi:hypothetical protein
LQCRIRPISKFRIPDLRFLRIVVGAGSGAAKEQSLAVGGINEIDSAGSIRAILRLKGVNDNLSPNRQRLLRVDFVEV